MITSIEQKRKQVLPIIVFSQFAGTSLWFAGNAVVSSLQKDFGLADNTIGHITSAVQLGFILGTLIFALFTISDRFSPSKVFFFCALAGAIFNLGIFLLANDLFSLLLFRVLTGFFLAGIYPVGMKIAADWNEKGIGKALGYLVGALVLGTAFPHLMKDLAQSLSWKYVLMGTSFFAGVGGLLVLVLVPDGPFRKKSQKLNRKALFTVFRNKSFRSAAFGYFGHMWELYAFWAFIPLMLGIYKNLHPEINLNISFFTFLIIAVGGPGCVAGGYLAEKIGSDKVAFFALLLSFGCCVLSPLLFQLTLIPFLLFLFFWGMVVVADSPQFSALVTQTAAKETVGTSLTIVNCIGFSITIISIQLLTWLGSFVSHQYLYIFLAFGPLGGLVFLYHLVQLRANKLPESIVRT